MKYDDVVSAWDAQANEANKWGALGEDEKIEWACKLVEQATLNRAAKVCWDTAVDQRNHDVVKLTAAKLMQQINLLKDSND